MLKPPTSSCSASTRSNGGRFSSAVAAIRKIINGKIPVEKKCQSVILDWAETMPLVESVPEINSTEAKDSPSAAS